MHSPELQDQIDALYAEWFESRAKWKTPRGWWFPIILKLRTLDTFRHVPRTPLSEKELLGLRAGLRTARPTQKWHWSVRRDGDAVTNRARRAVVSKLKSAAVRSWDRTRRNRVRRDLRQARETSQDLDPAAVALARVRSCLQNTPCVKALPAKEQPARPLCSACAS